MNTRLQELAEQAEQYVNNAMDERANNKDFTFGDIDEMYDKKFAELIVRECIAKAEEESERYLTWNTEDCNRFSKVMQNYKELLKEHFGVEE